jgi:hypothetical protein
VVVRSFRLVSICGALFAGTCQRSGAASFVPSLRVQLSASRQLEGASGGATSAPWDVSVTGWLRFAPSIAAAAEPLRAEWSPTVDVSPCDLDDTACLEEFAEGEREAAGLLGELE